MTYKKPELVGYQAIAAIQSLASKQTNSNELSGRPTQPAYEADE